MIQAGAELGQAQLKLELDFTLIFCRFGLAELVGWYILLTVYLVLKIQTFCLVDLILKILFCRFDLVNLAQ